MPRIVWARFIDPRVGSLVKMVTPMIFQVELFRELHHHIRDKALSGNRRSNPSAALRQLCLVMNLRLSGSAPSGS
jgi:hypothetical protein